jgi:rhomboid protease GluP
MPRGATEGGIVTDPLPHRDPTPTPPSAPFDWDHEPSQAERVEAGLGVVEAPAAPTRPQGLALPSHPVILTRALLLINLVMFVVTSLLSQGGGGFMEAVLGGADGLTLMVLGAKENSLILRGDYWRLLTPIFLHIGIVHLAFNSYALNLFGREVESLFGSWRFAVIYFLAGIGGSILSFAFSPAISAGASGAIFGVIGAMAAFLIRNRTTLGAQGRQHLQSLLFMIGINLFLGVTLPGIDNYGHIGGLVVGFVLGFLVSPTYTVESDYENMQYPRVVERPNRLPIALVAVVGMVALTGLFWLAMPIAPL